MFGQSVLVKVEEIEKIENMNATPQQAARAEQAVDTPKHGTLMIVEDDILLLKIFERFFAKHYNLITAKSGNEALELIKKGLRPEVILSDQRMPGLSGDEFLAETIKYVPDAVRTILTAHSDPKEIIAAINRAHTYMFLSKPIEEIELVQAVRLCFTHYSNQLKNKNLQRELTEKNTALQNVASASKNPAFPQQIIELNKRNANLNSCFFVDFFETCLPIIKTIAISMKLNATHYENIILATHTYIFAMNFMPAKFINFDPEELSDLERIKFFDLWQSIVSKIGGFDGMAFPAQVISQLWENHDGTGYPKGVAGHNIMMESQILKIVFMYVNNVFRLPKELYYNRAYMPEFKQPLAVTAHRHKAVTKIVFDRAKWFDTDLSNQFRFMLQDTANEAFSYERRDITTTNRDFDPILVEKQNAKKQNEQGIEDDENSRDKTSGTDRSIKISDLQEGMLVGQSIVTKSGILVARAGASLTNQLIKNIQHLDNTGQLNLKGIIDVVIP